LIRAAAALALLTACQDVPDVTYDDGSTAVPDADNTCPAQVPPYATICCGPIACYGPNCVATCNDCTSRCPLPDLCCPNAQNQAQCHANLQCH
jgi:hypothetical protein